MKDFKKWILRIVLIALCLSVFSLVGCEYLPIDFGGSDVTEETPHEHTLVEHEGKAATCTEGGWLPYTTCSGCDEYTTYEATEPLGHDYTEEYLPGVDSHSKICQICADAITEDHVWQTGDVILAPTCDTEGTRAVSCTVCGALKSESIDPLGHDYSGECTSSGDSHAIHCVRCDDAVLEAHAWTEDAYVAEPTCVTEGVINYVCLDCGATKDETVEPLGHDFSDEFTPNGAEHRRVCTRCTASTDNAPHSYEAGEIITAPTCTATGIQAYACPICGDAREEILDVTDHTYSDTYLPNGDVHSRFCSGCDATIDGEHTWVAGEVTKAPTCNESGSQKYTCRVCADSKQVILDATGHTYSDTYLPNGDVHSRFCSGCDATIDGEHTWVAGEIAKDSTCVETGTQIYDCEICGATKNEIIPVKDEHIDGGWETLQMPTATVRGTERLRCAVCNKVLLTREIPCDADSMTILYLVGEYQKATAAKNEVGMTFTLVHPDGTSYEGGATIKVQGATSVSYPKKNYTVKFYKDDTLEKKQKIDLGWGKESKYVIKANWVDAIQARNVVSCRLWGDIVASRNPSANQQRLAALPTNGGAIDGFPISVYMNGEFYGLYTMNVPKDDWLFGMDESETEAILCADDWVSTDFSVLLTEFTENSAGDLVANNGGWELKYCGTDDTSWVTESFNNLIRFCQEKDGEEFKNGISQYLDVDASIDYLIYLYAVLMRDNTSKNMNWITYDGVTWIPSVYDQDGTFGMVWDGKRYATSNSNLPSVKNGKIGVGFSQGNGYFILWDKIWNNFTEEILIRYKELRETVLSYDNMVAEFEAFRAEIPDSIYAADIEYWAADRAAWWKGDTYNGVANYYEKFDYDYIYTWLGERLAHYDNAMRTIYEKVYLPSTDNPAL